MNIFSCSNATISMLQTEFNPCITSHEITDLDEIYEHFIQIISNRFCDNINLSNETATFNSNIISGFR